jgi:thiol-disulfide isomerase/thioredoxin
MRLFNIAAGLIAMSLLVSAARAAEDTESLKGQPAPDFSLKTLDGKDVKLSDLKGNVVVLDFWATWCPPCRASLPHLNKVAENKELAEKGLKVLAVNDKEASDKVEGFMTKNKYSFAVPMDADGSTMTEYKVRGIPTTIVVGRDGVIRNVFIGYSGEEGSKKLDAAIEKALKEGKPGA